MLSVDTAKHLAGLLARRGINSIAVRTGADEDKSHLDGAFEILRHQRPDSWDDVIQQLNLLKGHSSARLIRRFNERLLHHLLLGDPETLAGTPRQRARIACYRDLMIASLLLAAGHTKSAAHIAQQTITRATQWEIAAAEIQALRFLRRRYATRGDNKKQNQSKEKFG